MAATLTASLRTPDSSLTSSSEMLSKLNSLDAKAKQLSAQGLTIVDAPSVSAANRAWGPVLAGFRVLTISITARGQRLDPSFVAQIYESAADAALLGGGLPYFLTCVSRLLRDLYPQMQREGEVSKRRDEFIAYNYLYFGTVTMSPAELNNQLRKMPRSSFKSTPVVFARRVVDSVRRNDGITFLRFYSQASKREQCIMASCLSSMRDEAAKAIIRVYMELETEVAQKFLQLRSKEEVFRTIHVQMPRLSQVNINLRAGLVKLRAPK